ncbi:hypothetical protein GCM10010517_76010 [Streptosporangium fragile]|uniref:Carrier domain-containing protein n=1 Tax=Streptosporangium fragile TaxID=46186 RepID=A0ABN3WAV6_9ACTN
MLSPLANESSKTLWVQAFRDVLESNDIDGDTDFFQAGGYSLLLPRLLWRYESLAGWRPPLRLVFEYSSPLELAAAADEYRSRLPADEPVDEHGPSPE